MSAPVDQSWPPATGLATKVVPVDSTILQVHGSISIEAPAAVVYATLIKTTDYNAWCTFCPRATIHSQPESQGGSQDELHLGTSFTFHVVMDSKKPTKFTDTQLRVTDISTPANHSNYISRAELDQGSTFTSNLDKVYRIAWTTEGGFVARGLRSERFSEIIIRSDTECEYRTWECQGGSLARVVKWMYKDVLMQKFQDWCHDLKRQSEEAYKSGASVDG